RGALYALREACKVKGMTLSDARVAVQGFGNAGSIIPELVAQERAQVVAVCDSKCGLINESGIYVRGVLKHKQETGSLRGFPGAKGRGAGAGRGGDAVILS